MSLRVLILIPVVLIAGAAASLRAQESPAVVKPAQVAGPEAPRTLLPADFVQFAPKTALDMLNRVPGFTIREESQERGFGQATGNVVINGQRISGKSNDVLTALSRIPAPNVQRIEIVDSATLDIPGLTGQVANVIVVSKGISGQYAYRPEFRAYNTDPLLSRFEVSVGGTRGPVEYTIGLDNRASRSGASGPTWIYSPGGSLIEDRDEHWKGNAEQPRVSGKFVIDAPGTAKANLDLSYRRLYFDYLETGTRAAVGEPVLHREVRIDEGGHSYEIGGDYEFDLGSGRLKLIGVNRFGHWPSEVNLINSFADGSSPSASRSSGVGDEGEMIGRAEYRWTRMGAEWQVSGEAAFNSLDNVSRLFEMRSDGIYEEVPLEGGSARVEEDRYELMGSYGRTISKTLAMKASVGAEYSQLGNASGSRTFQRPKGELSAAWQASPLTAINFKLARRVGQLNFYDFLASVNLRDDTRTAANPDLVPQQSWELKVETVRNLGKYGTTTFGVGGELIDDIIDYIPIGVAGEAPGNIDKAVVYGINSRSTLNLDAFGWKGARLDVDLALQESRVEDPLTGQQRRISNTMMRQGSIDLRHDIPASDWAWGGGASYQLNSLNYRLTEVGRQWEGPVWVDLFLEHKNVGGLTVRAGAVNLIAADSMWDRTVYVGRRTGPVQYIEERDRMIGPIFQFAIRGKF